MVIRATLRLPTWTTYVLPLARTSERSEMRSPSTLTPPCSINRFASDTLGARSACFSSCVIESPPAVGKGFYYTMHNFQGERLASAVGSVYGMDRALEMAIAYGKERQAFGQPVGEYQVWRHRFAEHKTSVEAARWLSYRALDLMNRGVPCVREITMAKLFTSELKQKVVYDCMQIFGGFGYTVEYPISRMWRDARLQTIGAGSSEIMKEILAKQEKL